MQQVTNTLVSFSKHVSCRELLVDLCPNGILFVVKTSKLRPIISLYYVVTSFLQGNCVADLEYDDLQLLYTYISYRNR